MFQCKRIFSLFNTLLETKNLYELFLIESVEIAFIA